MPVLWLSFFVDRQWGTLQINDGTNTITLPLTSTVLALVLQHMGVSAQYNGLSNRLTITSSMSDPETIIYIALTH